MALLATRGLCAAATRLPFILLGSPPLRQISALLESDVRKPVKPAEISRQLTEFPTPASMSRFSSGETKTKEVKKRGFNAIIRWCAYHQDNTLASLFAASSSATEDSVTAMDDAVVRWLHDRAISFSCGQSLIILTFLCDVLQRLVPASPTAHATEPERDRRVDDLVKCIALVLEHAVSSRHLELQPFTVLLSAAYALDRVTHGNLLNLPAAALESIQAPDALWFALVHQSGNQLAEWDATPPGVEDRTQIETILTAMLLFDTARCNEVVGRAKGNMPLLFLRAFVRLARKQVEAARQQRQASAEVLAAKLNDLSSGYTSLKAASLAEAEEDAGVPLEDAALSLPHRRTAATWGAISMSECERISRNVQAASRLDRLTVLEYLLLVARSPEAYTEDDVAQLPRVMEATAAVMECRRTGVVDAVLAGISAISLETLLCLLPYVQGRYALLPHVTALLEDHVARHAATAGAGRALDDQITPTAARMVLMSLGRRLPWHISRYLLLRVLSNHSGLHAAMCAALERPLRLQGQGDDKAVPPLCGGTTLDAKELFSVEVSTVIVFFAGGLHTAEVMTATEAAERQAGEELYMLKKVLVCSINWKMMAGLAPSSASKDTWARFATSTVRFATLQLYVQDRLELHHLRDEEAMDEDVLLREYVVPALRSKTVPGILCRMVSRVIQILRHEAGRVEVLSRTLSLCAENVNGNGMLRSFVRYLAAPATELKVHRNDFTKALFYHRKLALRFFGQSSSADSNALKVHTITLTRVLRYLIAINAFVDTPADKAAPRLEVVRGWIDHYMIALTSAASSAAVDAAVADGTNPSIAAAVPAGTRTGEDSAAAGEEAAHPVEEPEEEDAEGATEERELCDSANHDDDLLKTPVTDADVEEVLSLVLQVGGKVSHRTIQGWAARFCTSHVALLEDALSDGDEGAWSTVDRPAGVDTASPLAPEAVSDGAEDALAVGPSQQLLPAHFVWLIRSETIKPPRPSPRLLRSLLWRAELAILPHVFSALLQAFKRTRDLPVLQEDLHVAATSFAILHARLKEVTASHEVQKRSRIVHASVAILLHHLGHTKMYKAPAMQQVFRPHAALRDADVPVAKGPEENVVLGDVTAESHAAAAPPTAITSDEAELVAEAPLAEGDELEDGSSAQELLALHAETEAAVLRTLPFLEPLHTKQLALGEFRQLAFFLPRVAPFLMHQLQPQLCDCSPRELLQLAAQYPAAATDVLASLAAGDIRLTVDLAEYITLARHLPAAVNDAVVRAHLPHMPLAWVTRVLSALSTRHEEVRLPLLRALVERAQATVDEGSESDRSLLLMVLQAYLEGTSASVARPLPSAHGATAEVSENLQDTKVLHGPPGTATVLLDTAERAARLELVRTCCDRVLSLDQIATVAALRFFLVGYPPSLYQVRERGVVAKVEQRLLPDVLGASPPNLKDLAALVQLLAEHHVLLPSTVRQIVESVFTEPVLRSIYAAATSSSDSAVAAALTSLLQVVATCASAGTAAPPQHGAAVLEPLMASVLRIFDATHHWLAALGDLLALPTAAPAVEAAARYMCAVLLQRGMALTPSDFARLVQHISRLKAWNLALAPGAAGGSGAGRNVDFDSTFAACYSRADAHSRCVLLRAIAMDTAVLRRFEGIVFLPMRDDVGLLSSEDLELMLAAVQQVSSELVAEPVLDAIDTRLLPMMDQCRRSALVRLLQCHSQFGIRDEAVVTAALQALDRQSTSEVKLDVSQVLAVLQSIATLCETRLPVRLVVMCFQRLEKSVAALTPIQQYQVGRLILDLEMGFIPSVSALVLHILDSRDSARGRSQFQAMAEELCSVFEVELPPTLRATRLRKQMHKQRVRDFWSAQRRVKQQALLYHGLTA